MTAVDERAKISAAMSRLLDGIPLRSDGALTVVSLAIEAEVKRHVLTHRHTDLKDEFYARVRAQDRVSEPERKLREQLARAQDRIRALQEENAELKDANEGFARVVNLLTLENEGLREGTERRVISIRSR